MSDGNPPTIDEILTALDADNYPPYCPRAMAATYLMRFREALQIIAGERQCIDNLLGNQDVAHIALHGK